MGLNDSNSGVVSSTNNRHVINGINVLITNARSLSPKIESLQNNFEAHELDFALVTESWLNDGETLNKDIIDLEHGTGLKILYKNRPRRAAGVRRVGVTMKQHHS